MWEIYSKLTIEAIDLVLVSLLVTLNILHTFIVAFFLWVLTCKYQMEHFTALKIQIYVCFSESNLGALPHLRWSSCNNSEQQFSANSNFFFTKNSILDAA